MVISWFPQSHGFVRSRFLGMGHSGNDLGAVKSKMQAHTCHFRVFYPPQCWPWYCSSYAKFPTTASFLWCALSCRTLATPWIVAHQAPLSMEILQARVLEGVATPSSRGSFQPRDQTQVSCIAGGLFTSWATREAQKAGLSGVGFEHMPTGKTATWMWHLNQLISFLHVHKLHVHPYVCVCVCVCVCCWGAGVRNSKLIPNKHTDKSSWYFHLVSKGRVWDSNKEFWTTNKKRMWSKTVVTDLQPADYK